MTRVDAIELDNKVATPSRLYNALSDIFLGIGMWRIWLVLGWQDIRLRYRRSNLGPFWITISMSVTIYSLGILYGHMWKVGHKEYILYLACGLLSWALITTIVNESTSVFLEAKGYLLQMHIPLSVFIMRLLVRNLIIFLHNILAVVPLLIYYHASLNWHALVLLPNLLFILIPGFIFGMLVAILGLRFRDLGQLIISLMNLALFATPIMWVPANLPEKFQVLVSYNPFAQFVDLIREPLMGQLPSAHAYLTVLFVSLIGSFLMLWCFSKVKHRVVFWL